MTVCYYLRPQLDSNRQGEFPLIAADTMGTYRDRNHLAIITPATISKWTEQEPSRVMLVRKSYILGLGAVAFAGCGGPIERCLQDVAEQMPIWLLGPDPMGRLSNLVNERDGVEIVGAAHYPAANALNYISPEFSRRDTRHFGQCAVIGSGQREIYDYFDQMQQDLDLEPRASGGERALAFTLNLNASCLAMEAIGMATDWGGYLEHIHLSGDGTRWERGPRSAHFFLITERLENNKATTKMLGRCVSYDPGGDHGRILSVSATGDQALMKEFVLENLLTERFHSTAEETNEFWSGWQPEYGSVTVIDTDGVSAPRFSTRLLTRPNIDSLSWSFKDGVFSGGPKPPLFEDLSRNAMQQFGFEYISSLTE